MNQFKPLPPLEELEKLFVYDPDKGLFTNKTTRTHSIKGNRADFANGIGNGYRRLNVKGERYLAHRVAWLLATGKDPSDQQVDHVDRVRNHNWISNLRLATHGQNQVNTVSKGWYKQGSSFIAQIKIDGNRIYLGSYKTSEEAFAAFQKKHIEVYGEFSPYLAQ